MLRMLTKAVKSVRRFTSKTPTIARTRFHTDSSEAPAPKDDIPITTCSSQQTNSITDPWEERARNMPAVPHANVTDAEELVSLMRNSTPLTINNFQARFVHDAFQIPALEAKFGDMVVRVSVSQSGRYAHQQSHDAFVSYRVRGRFDGPEGGSLWGLNPEREVLVRPPTTAMFFSDFLKLIRRQTPETFYLEYLSLTQYLGTEMMQLAQRPTQSFSADLQLLVSNFWVGGAPTTSPLHYDDYENLLCQIRGNKEVCMVIA
jgi:jumonji domain-containing protein 7